MSLSSYYLSRLAVGVRVDGDDETPTDVSEMMRRQRKSHHLDGERADETQRNYATDVRKSHHLGLN